MFNIGASELILILVIAFVVVGPQDLPKVARALGRFLRGIRQMMDEVRRETGIGDLEKEFREVKRDLQSTVKSVQKDVDSAAEDVRKAADISQELRGAGDSLQKEVQDIKKDLK